MNLIIYFSLLFAITNLKTLKDANCDIVSKHLINDVNACVRVKFDKEYKQQKLNY
jgi:hypothetical protein